jgi:hypothetical protein
MSSRDATTFLEGMYRHKIISLCSLMFSRDDLPESTGTLRSSFKISKTMETMNPVPNTFGVSRGLTDISGIVAR